MTEADAAALLRSTITLPEGQVKALHRPFADIFKHGEWKCLVGKGAATTVLVFIAVERIVSLDAIYAPGKAVSARSWTTNPLRFLTKDDLSGLVRRFQSAPVLNASFT